MEEPNPEKIIERFNKKVEEWKKVQDKAEVNLKGLKIILQKFLLFNVKDREEDEGQMVDRIIKSYQRPVEEKNGDLLEMCADVFKEERESRTMESQTGNSSLIPALLINHPGTIDLFLQKQSNKILQIVAETLCILEEFKCKNLAKIEEIKQECEVMVNRNLNRNFYDSKVKGDGSFQKFQFVIETLNGISKEIGEVSDFCVNLELYPRDDSKIKKYLHFLENFKFLKK